MNIFIKIGLFVFVLYIPIYLVMLFLSSRKFPNYSYLKDWVSLLGQSNKKSGNLFNISTIILGFLSIFISLSILRYLSLRQLPQTIFFALLMVNITTLLIGFLPMDKYYTIHNLDTLLIFIFVLITSIYLLLFPEIGLQIQMIKIICIFIVFLIPFSVIAKRNEFNHSYRNKLLRIICINKGFWEWSMFLSAIIWNFVLGIALLTKFI
jgi:hypothetical membrane protein